MYDEIPTNNLLNVFAATEFDFLFWGTSLNRLLPVLVVVVGFDVVVIDIGDDDFFCY